MTISKVTPEDFQSILGLQKAAFYSEAVLNNDFDIPTLHEDIAGLEERYHNNTMLKYTLNNQLVGSVSAKIVGDICHISRLMVHPNYQGQQIGSALLYAIEKLFRDCREYQLFTGLKSARNIAMYQHRGYRITHVAGKLTYLAKINKER